MKIIFACIAIIALIWAVRRRLEGNFIVGCFKRGNVMVSGLRGRGKDALFQYVIMRRKEPYISNVNYGGRWEQLDLTKDMSAGGNTFENMMTGHVAPYEWQHEDGTDIYISDAGIYFPCQYGSQLDRQYKDIPLYMALSRHLGNNNVHINSQSINRPWNKLREQSDIYIRCLKTSAYRLPRGRAILVVRGRVYTDAQACERQIKEWKSEWGKNARMEKQKFTANYGEIKKFKVAYITPKEHYNDRGFREMLKPKTTEDKKEEENIKDKETKENAIKKFLEKHSKKK